MAGGKFITLEGGEGAGKSTQAKRLAVYLNTQTIETVLTREVGGSPSAEEIRTLWLGKSEGHWDSLTELLLISAARREHLVKTIWPALERGAWVISDRFADSTQVYQGVGLKMGVEVTEHFYRHVAGDFAPDLTLLLDLPAEAGLQRMRERRGEDDRYQQKDIAFHKTLRDAYLALAKHYPQRVKTVDASQKPDDVATSIRDTVRAHFGLSS